jgi:hypothetical protein
MSSACRKGATSLLLAKGRWEEREEISGFLHVKSTEGIRNEWT